MRTRRSAGMRVRSRVRSGTTMGDAAKSGLTCTFVTWDLETGEYFFSCG